VAAAAAASSSSRFEVWYEIMEVHNFLVLCQVCAYNSIQIRFGSSAIAAIFLGLLVDLQLISPTRQYAQIYHTA
jgi:cell shape-determining protein MreD